MIHLLLALCLAMSIHAAERSSEGLILLYNFVGDDEEVVDRSGFGEPLNLKIANSANVKRGGGALRIQGSTRIASSGPASKVIRAIRRSEAFSAEVWLRADNRSQEGPARVISISANTSARNFTLGQEGPAWDARFRSSRSDDNGMPSLKAPRDSVSTEVSHLIYTRAKDGTVYLYQNGREIAKQMRAGDLKNWDQTYSLLLANELSGDRSWQGDLFLVALFDRALSAAEAKQHFEAGPGAKIPARRVAATPPEPQPEPKTESVPVDLDGALAFYDFKGDGPVIQDHSGHGNNLRIADMKAVRRGGGKLEIRGKTLIRGKGKSIATALRKSRALTIEAWLQPANKTQDGPARIVTLSRDPVNRNFTLGQDGSKFDARLRTPQTGNNGTPSLSSSGLSGDVQHVVFTRDRRGTTGLFVDGKKRAEGRATGDFSNWDQNFELALGNELSGDRPWLGSLYTVVIYARDLAAGEVQAHFAAGPELRPEPSPALAKRLFVDHIAPILATHCIECHDPASNKGELDLSRREAFLAGGESGPAIVPGKHAKSLLWEVIAEDEMPKKRSPLSDAEKAQVRRWLDAGGDIALPEIDPAAYLHAGRGGERWVQRLTVNEYINTVQATAGVDIADDAKRLLPKDLRADGFSNTAYNLSVDFKHIDAYSQLATTIVDRMDMDAFLAEFATVDTIGQWLLRGPLEKREKDTYVSITDAVRRAGGDDREALRFVIEAMLQSPRFLYRLEDQLSTRPSGWEMATRLSYIVWGAPPDRALFASAETLHEPAAIAAQVDRMLKAPQAVTRSREFASEWLNLNRLQSLQPNQERFPNWTADLGRAMKDETLAFFEDVVWKQQGPLADLLSAQASYASPSLARHYGPVPRRGLLMQGSVLTIGGDEASMVSRGLFIMHELLRGVVKDPPPCVDTTPIPSKPGKTQRAIALERINDRSCGGCHAKFEPLAFGLEKFDGVGAFHERDEHGNFLREDGEILVPGEAKAQPYANAAELMQMLAASPRVQQSLTWKVAQFALGRPLVGADVPAMNDIHTRAQKSGGTYPAIIRAIATSDLVRKSQAVTN
jgi:hypothetical protein